MEQQAEARQQGALPSFSWSIPADRCKAAARGEVILHWDDDDFHEPRRVSAQVAPIASGEADVTALEKTHFLSMPDLKAFKVRPGRGGLLFASLAYRTSVRLPPTF